ncbi:MAG: ribosomal RNA small subunit methyltransferase H [Planctomycetota bacterium]|nr:MAG: ribosomal RNA small subunit methyltransferase H [Planctomycetota bacterium]
MDAPRSHIPVMAGEVVELLGAAPGRQLIDLTAGAGGHSMAFLEAAGAGASVIACDRDAEALSLAEVRLAPFAERVQLEHGDSVSCLARLRKRGVRADAILLDLGVSSMQLDESVRGFSLRTDGPLDMRMDRSQARTAADLLNRASEEELTNILRDFGDEPRAAKLAQSFVERRERRPWRSTGDLRTHVETVLRRRGGKIHPATRVFQALRMAVNAELDLLREALPAALDLLAPGGRLVVISFHSGEDRIVKETFRAFADTQRAELLSRKPLRPTLTEQRRNTRSRSARVRGVAARPRDAS